MGNRKIALRYAVGQGEKEGKGVPASGGGQRLPAREKGLDFFAGHLTGFELPALAGLVPIEADEVVATEFAGEDLEAAAAVEVLPGEGVAAALIGDFAVADGNAGEVGGHEKV